ncbi:MAG TPA: hypothetical protein VJJ24_03390 [Candidatus Paceibacterota bacterium]
MKTLRHKTLAGFKWGLVVGGIVLILSYGFYAARDLITGTDVVVTYPTDSVKVNDPMLDVSGHVGNVAWLSFNGGQILSDEKGNFKETVMLAPGYNEIEIKVIDKFNREINKILRVVYAPETKHTALNI